jgi:DNA polymerase II small subunit
MFWSPLRYTFAPLPRCVGVPSEETARIVAELADRGYNADREAVTLLARASDRDHAIDRAVETAPEDTLVLSADHVERALADSPPSSGRPDPDEEGSRGERSDHSADAGTGNRRERGESAASPADATGAATGDDNPSVSTGTRQSQSHENGRSSPDETKGLAGVGERQARSGRPSERGSTAVEVSGDIQSTGTGEYGDFVSVFRDRYERLADLLGGRVNHRPAEAVADLSDGSEAALVGMVADAYTTSGGHWRFVLEDTSGTYPCLVMDDSEHADRARRTLHDEVIAVEGRISKNGGDDDGILFVDEMHVPDVPHTHSPSTADRPVRAALVSDIHVGSQEFVADAWSRFADWLHTDSAADIEYLLVAGDMVEGVGVYPDQDEELDIVDIYDQYERFSEHLKNVPGDMEIVMIPGNHDAVRLAEPQPAFDEELRSIMSAHDATISANPSTVTIEGVSVLMYHGVSLDELIADLSDATYERPAEAMTYLLEKRHLAPQYGGQVRIAPEERDHLVIEEVPDIFHTGHVHKFGYTTHRGVLAVNSSCWQSQTDFQASVNLDPDVAYAPIVDLQTLDLRYAQFV